MEKVRAVQPFDATTLPVSWTGRDSGAAVVLVDETKGVPLATPQAGGAHGDRQKSVTFFHAVVAEAKSVAALIDGLGNVRRELGQDETKSFKSSDFWRRTSGKGPFHHHQLLGDWEMVEQYSPIVGQLCSFYRDVPMVYCAATTDRLLEENSAKVTQKVDRESQVESSGTLTRRHGAPFLTFLKWIAEAAKFGKGVVYVVVDGSADLALKPGTCFRVDDANRKPGGRETAVTTETSFDIFVSGDKEVPLRDALLAPDFLGNLAVSKLRATTRGYSEAVKAVLEGGETCHAFGYPLSTLLDLIGSPSTASGAPIAG